MRTAVVQVPGTCGELVQGSLDGIRFHVTCPIDVYSQATVAVDDSFRGIRAPGWARKAHHALRLAWCRLAPFSGRPGIVLELFSPLARGKGLGSSTADVAAAITALAEVLEVSLSLEDLASLALAVEPSDGSFLPGVALFDHREGRLSEQLIAEPPRLRIIVLDCGGEVDTEEFNRVDHSQALQQAEPAVREALQLVRHGLVQGDWRSVGEGATASSIANQAILYKPQLETVIGTARDVGALGVNCAHSGTVLGLLLEPGRGDCREVTDYVRRKVVDVEPLFVANLVGGGARVLDPSMLGLLRVLPGEEGTCQNPQGSDTYPLLPVGRGIIRP